MQENTSFFLSKMEPVVQNVSTLVCIVVLHGTPDAGYFM
jgi:hypothetical protein